MVCVQWFAFWLAVQMLAVRVDSVVVGLGTKKKKHKAEEHCKSVADGGKIN